jgi:hypothetical protein
MRTNTTSKLASGTQVAEFHIPTKPYDATACLNRIALAQGSMSYASKGQHADYNGNHITVVWNDYRGYYICEYMWAGRQVVARSENAESILKSAISEYMAQGLGASLSIQLRGQDAVYAEMFPKLIEGKQDGLGDWWTWKHEEMASAYRLEKQLGRPYAAWLLKAETIEEYRAMCAPKKNI